MSTTESPSNLECSVLVLRIAIEGKNTILGFDNGEQLRNELLAAAVESDAEHVVIDLSEVDAIQSAGFRPLLTVRRYVNQQRGGKVALTGLRDSVREVLLLTRMIDPDNRELAPFHAYPDVASAVANLD